MADVFISYQRGDRDAAKRIDAALRAAGFTTWWDTSLVAGEHWNESIRAELRLARCVLVVWSRSSWESRWVQAEAHAGFERDILIAARIDDVHLEPPFNVIQTADLRLPRGMEDVLSGVRRKLPTPQSAAAPPRSNVPPPPRIPAPAQHFAPPPRTRRSTPTNWDAPNYFGVSFGIALFGIVAFAALAGQNDGDPRANFFFTPAFVLPLAYALFRRGRIGWWGAVLLVVGVCVAHMAATVAADMIYVRKPFRFCGIVGINEECARLALAEHARHAAEGPRSALVGGGVGGALGALLSFATVALLDKDLRTQRTLAFFAVATAVLTGVGAIGFVGELPDSSEKRGSDWVFQLYAPWQLLFAGALVWAFRDHKAKRYVGLNARSPRADL